MKLALDRPPMMPWGKTVALHIGAHKTGTSVVQRYLREHELALRERGIKYLYRAHLSTMAGWGDRLAMEPGPLSERLRRFRWDPRFRVLIGSYENLVGRPFPTSGGGQLYPDAPANIAALRRATGRTRVRVLLSIRPQPDFVESYYLQVVHEGGHAPFREWLGGVDLDRLSWRPIVDACREQFGADNVAVLDFRRIRDGQDAWLRHVLAAAHPSLDVPVHYPADRNRSVSARGLEMALAANPHLRTGEERAALRRFLQTHFSNADFPRPMLFTATEKDEIWARYREEYEDLTR